MFNSSFDSAQDDNDYAQEDNDYAQDDIYPAQDDNDSVRLSEAEAPQFIQNSLAR